MSSDKYTTTNNAIEIEVWANIPGFSYYQVSTHGQIKSFRSDDVEGRILKQYTPKDRYPQLELQSDNGKKTVCVHRIMGIVFLPNPQDKPFVNHKDGNKANNHLSNLEWCTVSENTQHAVDNGLLVPILGEKRSKRLRKYQVVNIKKKLLSGENVSDIAREYEVNPTTISNIKAETRWSHVTFPEWEMGVDKLNGGRNRIYKLSEEDVIEIKKLLVERSLPYQNIADKFGVDRGAIYCIRSGKTYEYIDVPGFTPSKETTFVRTGLKLTEPQVREIKDKLDNTTLTQQEIAAEYGVSGATISNINTGKVWKNL